MSSGPSKSIGKLRKEFAERFWGIAEKQDQKIEEFLMTDQPTRAEAVWQLRSAANVFREPAYRHYAEMLERDEKVIKGAYFTLACALAWAIYDGYEIEIHNLNRAAEEIADRLGKLRSDLVDARDERDAEAARVRACKRERDAALARVRELEEAAKAALHRAQSMVCTHESTHRGGAIWTICDSCGARWADDRGGFQPYVQPAEWDRLEKLLADEAPAATGGGDEE